MASVSKFEELAGYALENGIRLHLDSIEAYRRESYATAYQLSIIASEEIGKSFMLEDYVFNSWANGWSDNDQHTRKYLTDIFSAHATKQRVFAYHVNGFLRRHPLMRNASSLIKPLFLGKGEEDKQNSTFVGLTKKGKKVDINGKMIIPRLFAQPDKSKKQITLTSDFLKVYIDGFLRGIYSTDSYSMACQMDKDTFDILKNNWEYQGSIAVKILKSQQDNKYLENPLYNWDE